MKKYTLYSIVAVLLLIIITVGSTYAYLSSTVTTPNNSILSSTTSLNIIYSGGTTINNTMSVASNKDEGYNTTVSIRLAPNSAIARSDLYIYINEITSNIAIPGFIWEVYGYRNSTLVYSDKGNFSGYNDTTNNKVRIVNGYLLSETETTFTVYFWIDGSKTDNNVIGGTFNGYIGATSQEFTAVIEAHTVRFDANGGTIPSRDAWTGSGASATKLVEYGKSYGDLPTPTRPGYRFLGWNGKNLLNPNLLLQQTSWNKLTISAKPNTVYTMNASFDNEKLLLYLNNVSQYGPSYRVNSGHNVTVQSGSDGLLYIQQRTTDVSVLFSDYDIQLEEGSTATAYEPYYITSSTTVVQDSDHTLTAIWEPVN